MISWWVARVAGGRPVPRPHDDPRVAASYVRLECPIGADLDTVRAAYHRLMRQNHPDLQSGDPRRQQIATMVTARLSEAYQLIERALDTIPR